MKTLIPALILFAFLFSCSTTRRSLSPDPAEAVRVTLDLVNVQDDKVEVTVSPPPVATPTVQYRLPKIIPGTYAIADYGRYVEDFQAFDADGQSLSVERTDTNTWKISDATRLRQVSYRVNDTFDSEEGSAFSGSQTIFSPAGTNILAGENFVLNLCGFAGYFTGMEDLPYLLTVRHPESLYGATAMVDTDPENGTDLFAVSRYAELVDSPIMYARPDTAVFVIDGMEVLLSIYSPKNREITASRFAPDLEKMVRAQKSFLGKINKTPKYAILVYVTDGSATNARGIGALEHNTSTTSVFGEGMTSSDLIDVISHEFFHTLTPLNVHSREIHYFDFNDPAMSEHLWMYEGITEYFAQLFQVDQGLIGEDEFFKRMGEKIMVSRSFRDDLSFTEMSRNVLEPEMEAQYGNVYQKGALMAMCLDIIIRERSGGKEGLRDVMGKLARKYGPDRPFDDKDLIPEFTRLSFPEAGDFLKTHVVEGVPVDYDAYMARMGLEPITVPVPSMTVFLADNNTRPYLRADPEGKGILAADPGNDNRFFKALGVKDGDRLLSINGKKIDPQDIMGIFMMGSGLEEGSPITAKVEREGKEMELKGEVQLNYEDGLSFKFTDMSKRALKEAWLRGDAA